MKTTNKNNKDTRKQINEDIQYTLSSFPIIKDRTLKQSFDSSPLGVVASTTIITFAGWYTKTGVDLLYLTGGMAIVTSLFFARALFEEFPHILLMLWRRKILCLRRKDTSFRRLPLETVEKAFLEFVQAVAGRMNKKIQILFGASGIIITFWTIWLLDIDILQEIYINFETPFSWYGIMLLVRLSFLLAGFVGGIIAWRILVIADTVSKLGEFFEFDLQINHPDGCGGLRPIGDLCLKLAYVISPFPILLGLWLIFISFLDLRYLRMIPENIGPLTSTLVILAIPMAALCLFSFFLPLGTVHTTMLQAKSKLQIELDSLSQEIHQLSSNLLVKANSLDPREGTSIEEKIEFLKRVYARNSQIPTWPYRSTHLWSLISTQIVPSLGLISSIISFIRDFRR